MPMRTIRRAAPSVEAYLELGLSELHANRDLRATFARAVDEAASTSSSRSAFEASVRQRLQQEVLSGFRASRVQSEPHAETPGHPSRAGARQPLVASRYPGGRQVSEVRIPR